ncbi:hypothetical protein HK104_000414 [Borealophlyctis nickersoniae]|nr:hypothetical protein HK104_000414 [Borealophlyctis nickersoniae]
MSDRVAHSLAPEYLEREIGASLARLGLETVDVFMLNNPERLAAGRDKKYGMSQVYDIVAKACLHLGKEVQRGRIQAYGICSHSAANPAAPDHFSLSRALQASEPMSAEVSKNLVAVEYPFNMFEKEAYGHEEEGIMHIAKEHSLFSFTQRPLYAIANGQVRPLTTRFGVEVEDEPRISDELTKSFEEMAQLEADIGEKLSSDPNDNALIAKFVWAQVLAENIAQLSQNLFAARHYLERQVVPAVEADLAALQGRANELGDEEMLEWVARYRQSVHAVTAHILDICKISTLRSNLTLSKFLTALTPTLRSLDDGTSGVPLSVTAATVAASTLDVVGRTGQSAGGCVLVGMRREDYVKEIVGTVGMGPRLDKEEVETVLLCASAE